MRWKLSVLVQPCACIGSTQYTLAIILPDAAVMGKHTRSGGEYGLEGLHQLARGRDGSSPRICLGAKSYMSRCPGAWAAGSGCTFCVSFSLPF